MSVVQTCEFEQHGVPMVATYGESGIGLIVITMRDVVFDILEVPPRTIIDDPTWFQTFIELWQNGERSSASRVHAYVKHLDKQ